MKASFTILGKLAGMNEITRANRNNRFGGGKQKKAEQTKVMWAIALYKVPVFSKPVKMHFDWYEPNLKRDVGNVRVGEKFISDALVQMGKIVDDSQKWVKGMSDNFHLDRVNPRVEVTIEEL